MDFDHLIGEEEIILDLQNLSDGDLDVLVEVLQKSTVPVELRLDWNQITLADGSFSKALANNRTFQILNSCFLVPEHNIRLNNQSL